MQNLDMYNVNTVESLVQTPLGPSSHVLNYCHRNYMTSYPAYILNT